jgi:hypothetical protein
MGNEYTSKDEYVNETLSNDGGSEGIKVKGGTVVKKFSITSAIGNKKMGGKASKRALKKAAESISKGLK